MTAIDKFRNALRRIYYSDDGEQRYGARGIIAYLVRYSFHILGELSRDQCFLRAAALTFTTVMTLIPILVLLFVTFRAFGGFHEASQHVQQFLFRHMLPESVANIQNYIENLVSDFNTHAVSYISLLFLVGSAYALFASVDSSLNAIWGARQTRGFFNRLITIWFLLTVTPVLLGYSLYLTARFETVSAMDNVIIFTGYAFLKRFTPYLLSLVSLTLMYKLIPRTRVYWSSAILGGGFAALLWELSKYAFNSYVQNLANFKLIYGSFLTLPIFLIWVDLSWIIILAGAEIAFTHQHLDRLRLIRKRREQAGDDVSILSDKLGVYLFFVITEAFLDGSPVNRKTIRAEAPGNEWMIDIYIDRFCQAKLLFMDEEGVLVPARDISAIKASDLLDFFEPRNPREYFKGSCLESKAAMGLLDSIREARLEWLNHKSIRDIVQESSSDFKL